jgi:hypothetical protein
MIYIWHAAQEKRALKFRSQTPNTGGDVYSITHLHPLAEVRCDHLDDGALETMKLLLTAIISLTFAAVAFGGGPDAKMIPFRSDNGKPCTFTFEADGQGLIHVTLITNQKEIGITLEDLFPKEKKILLSKEQGETLKWIVRDEADGFNYYLPSIDPVTGKEVYFHIDYKKNVE